MPKVIGAQKQTYTGSSPSSRIHLASSGDIAAGTSSVEFAFSKGYDLFQIVFVDVHPSVTETKLSFQVADDGSSFDQNITSCAKRAQRREDNTDTWTGGYGGTIPLSNETLFQQIVLQGEAGDNDAGASGEMWFYNPLGSTYKPIWWSELSGSYGASTEYVIYLHVSGYIHTDSISHIRFVTTHEDGTALSGNIDDGYIYLFGWVTYWGQEVLV